MKVFRRRRNQNDHTAHRRKLGLQAGFTLIELLVVLVILGLLAGLVGPRILAQLGGAKSKTAKVQIENFATALDLYRLDIGSYPTTDQGLEALVRAPGGVDGWNGPYLSKAEVPLDPWKNPFQYNQPGENAPFDLYSLGADNQEGGDGENADITLQQ
ncbi:type II secretion system major pseudopilin GspG [Limibacillus sp. MBR-115]|jgi:general secretion pathway protein G|uniref:type II secretion system major pseudopilin GspG n=1 Tax=Limibacillus sp. MBR-115 TaxID=3156465 RepID=UPI0016125BC0